jgi:hypothetical protein
MEDTREKQPDRQHQSDSLNDNQGIYISLAEMKRRVENSNVEDYIRSIELYEQENSHPEENGIIPLQFSFVNLIIELEKEKPSPNDKRMSRSEWEALKRSRETKDV